MYREIAGTDERVRAIPGVRDRRVRATKVRLYFEKWKFEFSRFYCIRKETKFIISIISTSKVIKKTLKPLPHSFSEHFFLFVFK